MANYEKSLFIKKWMKDMTKTMKRMNPDWDEDEIKEQLIKMVDKNIHNPTVILDNNYTHENKNSTLLSVFDWALERKPILAGNGTFYKNQHEAINPIASMLDSKLNHRKALKKQMFKCPEGSDRYIYLDRAQGNTKRIVNSYYGGSGTPVSPFYSTWSGPKQMWVL